MAQIIFLHGASSSGKSTLARAVRAAASGPYVHLSFDHFRDSGAIDTALYADWSAHRAGVFDGYHRALAGFAAAGNDLIVEHILDTPGWHAQLQTLFRPFDLFFVGVHTPLPDLIHREIQRGDRRIGSAAADFASVHRALTYDLTVDGTRPASGNAQTLLTAMQAHCGQSSFFLAEA